MQSDLVSQAFLRADNEWRAFQQRTETERLRFRQIELDQQSRWLELFKQYLDLVHIIIDVLEKKHD